MARQHPSFLTGIFALFLAFFSIDRVTAEERSFSDFVFSLPPGFEDVAVDLPGVKLAVKHKEAGFPTFNVIAENQPLRIDRSVVSRSVASVTDSYKNVGINDVRIVSSSLQDLSKFTQAVRIELRYLNQGEEMFSTLALIPHGNEHLILTYLVPAKDRDKFFDAEKEIFSSFRFGDATSKMVNTGVSLMPLLLLIAVALAMGYVFYKRRGKQQ